MADQQLVTCQSCGGIYAPLQADGTEYYHTCPTRVVVQGATFDAVTGKQLTPPVFKAIANPRNENVKSVDDAGVVTIVAEGAGAVPVTDATVIASFSNTTQEGV